ncbi:High-affinity methionine permease [Colletotrichum viniferum]|nr:High-affinity methionine permease [Colletotrichum viniferum]
MPMRIQKDLVRSLESICSTSTDDNLRAAAAFSIAVAHVNGVGVRFDINMAHDFLLRAAKWGHEQAQAMLINIFDHQGAPDATVSLGMWIDWLKRTAMLGSDTALKKLKAASASSWRSAQEVSQTKCLESEGFGLPQSQQAVIDVQCARQLSTSQSLVSAIFHGRSDLVEELIGNNPQMLNQPVSKAGESPLLIACRLARVDIVKLLVKKQADASIGDTSGICPLHWLCVLPDSDAGPIAHLLHKQGGNPNALAVTHVLPLAISFRSQGVNLAVTHVQFFANKLFFTIVSKEQLLETILARVPQFPMMSALDDPELRPLLSITPPPPSPVSSASAPKNSVSSGKPSISEAELATGNIHPSRSIEDDVLPEASTLGRTLTWQSAYILVISRVIGSGIFATPGAILRSVGSPGLSLLLWLVGALIAACGLMISLEFGSMLPRSGGDKVYLEFTYRRPRFLASTLVAIHVVLLGFTASNCIVFSEYLLFTLGGDNPSGLLRKALAVGLLTTVTFIHGCVPRLGIKLQNFLGWVKVGLVVFMIVCGFYVVLFGPSTESAQTTMPIISWENLWEGTNWNWGIISTSLFKVFYSYAGLDNANLVLNEVKDPIRTLRSVTVAALTTACGMYLLINVAYFLVVPIDEIKQSGELIAALFFERIFGQGVGRTILPLAVALSAGGNVLVVAFAQARLKQEIARQGFLPFSDILSSTKPFNSPLGGLLVHYIPSFLVIALPPSGEVYSFILEVEGYPGQFMALAVGGGLLWLRFTRPDLKRPFKAWVPAVILRISLSLALLAAPFFPPKVKPTNGLFYATYAIVGVSILGAGVVYWYVWTILVPRRRGYRIEEKEEVLGDGTTITKLVHTPID